MSYSRKLSLVLVLAASVAAAFSASAEDAPARVRGTLQKMDGNNLIIATKSGKDANVPLKDGAPIIAVTKGAMSDIKDNTFVGITAMPQPDGTQKAVEVHVFEESLRGVGEGHYPWDLKPDSTMTNGAVAQQVQKVEGNTLQVKYKDGEKTMFRRTLKSLIWPLAARTISRPGRMYSSHDGRSRRMGNGRLRLSLSVAMGLRRRCSRACRAADSSLRPLEPPSISAALFIGSGAEEPIARTLKNS